MNDRTPYPIASRPDRSSRSVCPGCDGSGFDAVPTVVPPRIPRVERHASASNSSALHPLLTLSQVAELLRVSEKTIRRWMISKRLPHARLGRVVRFRQDELLRWIEARKEV